MTALLSRDDHSSVLILRRWPSETCFCPRGCGQPRRRSSRDKRAVNAQRCSPDDQYRRTCASGEVPETGEASFRVHELKYLCGYSRPGTPRAETVTSWSASGHQRPWVRPRRRLYLYGRYFRVVADFSSYMVSMPFGLDRHLGKYARKRSWVLGLGQPCTVQCRQFLEKPATTRK